MSELRRADEDAWLAPQEWVAKAAPFRGRGQVLSVQIDKSALELYRTWLADPRIERSLQSTADTGHPDLAAAGRAAIAHPETATALGIAVAGGLAASVADAAQARPALTSRLVDAWIAEYGVVAAAEAVVRLTGIRIGRTFDTDTLWCTAGSHPDGYQSLTRQIQPRLRAHLAALPDQDYRAVIEALGPCRAESATMRMVTSYLVPTEQDWVDEDLAAAGRLQIDNGGLWDLHLGTVTKAEQLKQFPAKRYDWRVAGRAELLTAALQVGPAAATYLVGRLETPGLSSEDQRWLASMLTYFPTDEALGMLLDRADRLALRAPLFEAMQRFPRRALRLLSARTPLESPWRELLTLVARWHPEPAAELGLSAIPFATAPLGILPVSELPELLRTPPWERDITRTPPPVLKNLGAPQPVKVSWLPGEREKWANTRAPHTVPRYGWATEIETRTADGSNRTYWLLNVLAFAPEELAAPLVQDLPATEYWNQAQLLRRVLGRFGDAAAGVIAAAVEHNVQSAAELLLPVTGTPVTTFMTRLLDTRRSRSVAVAWFDRNPAAAAPDLLVAAFGKAAKPRALAWKALHTLADRGHRDILLTAAATFGAEAATALAAELAVDPVELLPPKIPTLPSWLIPSALPPIMVRDTGRSLPPEAAATVCVMFALCSPNGDYAGVARIAELTEPDSLADFAWTVFETWSLAGYPTSENWALHVLGLVGNDETARRLTPFIRVWPGEEAHARAVTGLDVLVGIGSEVALMQLNSIAEKVKFKAIKTKAQEKIRQLAEDSGMSAEELADRLIPGFGLDTDGRLALDYGPRGFVAGFDEQLKPTVSEAVRDTDGHWQATVFRKSLPKPGAKDDPELAAAAYQAFTTLKKEVKATAAEQLQRLERAMVRNRRWTAATHRQLFIEHPLLWHMTRRLIWASFDANGTLTGSFRIAEDRSLADVQDDPIVLSDDTLVGIAHPLHLADALGTWGEVFADYEILQPFPQLQREVYAFTEEELASTRLTRFQDSIVPTAKVLGLSRFGWERGAPMDGGISNESYRVLGGDHSAVVDLEPGIAVGYVMDEPEQKISVRLSFTGEEGDRWQQGTPCHFADLDPVTASELLRELTILTD